MFITANVFVAPEIEVVDVDTWAGRPSATSPERNPQAEHHDTAVMPDAVVPVAQTFLARRYNHPCIP